MSTYFLSGLLIVVSVGLNTLAQTLLKLGSGQNPLNLYLFAGILSYGISTFLYIFILGKLNLSVAYPVIIGLTILATTISAAFFLGERVAIMHWLGLGLMLCGISAIAFGKIL